MYFIDTYIQSLLSSQFYYKPNPQFIIDNEQEVLNLLNTKYKNDITYKQSNIASTGTVYIPIEFNNLSANNPLKYGEIRIGDHPRNIVDKRHFSIVYNVCPQEKWDKSLTHLQNQLDLVINSTTSNRDIFVITIDKKAENITPTTNTNGTVDYKYTYNYAVELKTKYHVFIGNSINGVVSAVHDAFKKAMQWYKAQGINFPVNAKNLKKKIISFITQNANDIEQGKKTKYTQMYFSVIDDEFLTEKELTAWVAYIVNSTAIL